MTKFDADTALRRTRDGTFEGAVSPDWRIVRGANGAHLAAFLLRAMTEVVDDDTKAPRSFTTYFARVPQEAPVIVETTIERAGRRVVLASARMVQDGKLIIFGQAAFSGPWDGIDFEDRTMPDVPSPDEVDAVKDRESFPFGQRFDFRPVIGPRDGLGSADRAESATWLRLREHRSLDPLLAAQYLDAWAPAVFAKVGHSVGVPTIDMTFHFREQLPPTDDEPGAWYLGFFQTTTSREGFIEEDGYLWSASGRLVAHSRQLAIVFTSG